MDAVDRAPDTPTTETPPRAARSPVEIEFESLAHRLRGAPAGPEPLGTCVFFVGDAVGTAATTELQCEMLAGTWVPGATSTPAGGGSSAFASGTSDPVAAAVASVRTRAAGKSRRRAAEKGTCVYAAGNRPCRAEMSQLQCELLGGVWFRSQTSGVPPAR